ncbi:hypothetical protein J6590_091675 [Homalodisca vitripennis]|nr:hypothetical protein J6590_091675 [Homalodisca vitripennis]
MAFANAIQGQTSNNRGGSICTPTPRLADCQGLRLNTQFDTLASVKCCRFLCQSGTRERERGRERGGGRGGQLTGERLGHTKVVSEPLPNLSGKHSEGQRKSYTSMNTVCSRKSSLDLFITYRSVEFSVGAKQRSVAVCVNCWTRFSQNFTNINGGKTGEK